MHVLKAGRRILVIPHEWHTRLLTLVCYFARGPFFGVRQQIEPDVRPNRWRAAIIFAALVATLAAAPLPIQLGILWIIFSPTLLYVLSTVPETVYEHRGYILLLGFAMIGAWTSERAPWLTLLLLLLFVIRTIHRNAKLRTEFGFWELAYQESPNHWRPALNYACQLERFERDEEALRVLLPLIDAPRPAGEVAAQHLCALFLKLERWDDAERLIGDRGEMIRRFPNNSGLRRLRGALLTAQGKTEQAERAFHIAKVLA
jgi:hypothetical protein